MSFYYYCVKKKTCPNAVVILRPSAVVFLCPNAVVFLRPNAVVFEKMVYLHC